MEEMKSVYELKHFMNKRTHCIVGYRFRSHGTWCTACEVRSGWMVTLSSSRDECGHFLERMRNG